MSATVVSGAHASSRPFDIDQSVRFREVRTNCGSGFVALPRHPGATLAKNPPSAVRVHEAAGCTFA